MPSLDSLYQALLLSHAKSPRNFGPLSEASHHARAENAVCGDRFDIHLRLSEDRIVAVGFEGVGCAISRASASMMSTTVGGRSRTHVEDLWRRFGLFLAGDRDGTGDLGELSAFSGVARFPVRIGCARLPWEGLIAALTSAAQPGGLERS